MQTAVKDSPTEQSTAPSRPKVLVVDDVMFERRFVGALAERGAGLKAVYAEDGAAALEMIALESPVVVVTDLNMKGMDGLQLVEAVRAQHPHLPVVLMTAFGSEELAVRALRAGAASYVPKSELARCLASTLTQILEAAASDNRRRRVLGCLQGRESRYRIDNDPVLITEMVSLIRRELDEIGFSDETARTRVTVAVQEALANALYHGNLEVSSDLRQGDEREFYEMAEQRRHTDPYRLRRIDVHTNVTPGEVRFVIQDEGPGFDTSRLNRLFDPEDMMRVGGRGLLLMKAFMDEVALNETGNRVTLVKRRPGGGG